MTYEPPGGSPPPPQQPYQPPPMGAPYPATGYGVPGYGYAPAAQSTKPLKGLSTAVMILVGITGAASLFLAIALFHRASLLDDSGFLLAQDARDANDSVSTASGLFFLLLLAAGIVWIIWQFRFAKNAEAIRGKLNLAAGWAIGGWFVPFGNYVLPQLQLFQAAKASDPDVPLGHPGVSGSAPPIVATWWVSYDLAWLLFAVAQTMRPSNSLVDPDKFRQADRISGVSLLVLVGCAVVAILMVRALTERQTRAMAGAAGAYRGYQQPYQPPQAYGPPPVYGQPPQAYPPPPTYQQPPPPAYQPPPTYPQPPPPPAYQPPPPPQQWPPPAPPPPQ